MGDATWREPLFSSTLTWRLDGALLAGNLVEDGGDHFAKGRNIAKNHEHGVWCYDFGVEIRFIDGNNLGLG